MTATARKSLAADHALELWSHYRSYLPLHAAIRMARRHARTLETFDRAVAKALRNIVREHAR